MSKQVEYIAGFAVSGRLQAEAAGPAPGRWSPFMLVLAAVYCSHVGAQELLATIPVGPVESGTTAGAPADRPGRGLAIEEIIVTAQKREESINDVPISISAFTGDDLKALGVTDTRDLGNLVPGFVATDSGFNTPVYTLRGVGFNDTTYTATSTVGVYVDEINLPYSIMTKGAALDLQRVEVLKGPQGILYGRNTTGGAINYIANKPTEVFEAGVTGSYGRFQQTELQGFVSGNLVGSLNGRLAVRAVQSFEGSQYSNTRPDDRLGKQEKQSARGMVDWQPSDDLSLRFVLEGWRDESEPRAPQVIFVSEQNAIDPAGIFLPPGARRYPVIPQNGADPRVADWPDRDWQLHDRFLSGSLRTDWKLSDSTQFTGLLSRMRVSSNGSSLPQSGYNFNNAEQVIDAYIETTALELRLSGAFGDDIDWMIGTNLGRDEGSEYHLELLDSQGALFPVPVTGESLLGNRAFFQGQPETNQYAGFFNVGWRFIEDFKLTVGGRYTQTNERYTGCTGERPESTSPIPGVSITTVFGGLSGQNAAEYLLSTLGPNAGEAADFLRSVAEGRTPNLLIEKGDCFSVAPDGSTEAYADKLNEGNFSYRAALDWQPTDDTLFYVSLGRGYKAGGFPVLTATNQDQLLPVTQERLQAYEVGAKATVLDRQLHANVALYHYDYKDKQLLTKVLDPIFGPLPVLRNAPESQVQGAELDVQFSPSAIRGLFIAATAAYTRTEIKEFTSINSAGDEQDFSGKPFNFAPELQYTLLVNYSWPLGQNFEMTAGADYYHSSETNSSIEEDPRFDFNAYGLIGARLMLAPVSGRWTVAAFGRNLSNEFSTLAVYQNGDAISRIAGMARTYGISLDYQW